MTQNGSWDIESQNNTCRFLRIQNKGAPKHLCCSGIEFYGTLVDKAGKSHDFKWIRETPKVQEKQTCFMYFIAEETPDAKVPEGYSLCRVPDIDLQNGDIQPWFGCDNGDDDKAA